MNVASASRSTDTLGDHLVGNPRIAQPQCGRIGQRPMVGTRSGAHQWAYTKMDAVSNVRLG